MMESVNLWFQGEKAVANEEEDLKIAQNQDLNEEAEYAGNKQDLEQMLLEAQRYLNIFHQIHIFNDKKKEEFNQSLVHISDKLRAVLLNLPGGRVLIEYIEDYEVKKGLRTTRTVFNNDDPFIKTKKELEMKSEADKELTAAISSTIDEALAKYNHVLLQMNEKILQGGQHHAGTGQELASQAKVLADALRESNQQQMEMMKTFGTTLSEAILSSQKELLDNAQKLQEINAFLGKKNPQVNTQPSVASPVISQVQNLKTNPNGLSSKDILASGGNMKKEESKNTANQTTIGTSSPFASSKSSSYPKSLDTASVLAETRNLKSQEKENVKAADIPAKQETNIPNKTETKKVENEPVIKTTEPKKESIEDIDIMSLLSADENIDKKEDKKPEVKEEKKPEEKKEAPKEEKKPEEKKEAPKEEKKPEEKKEDKKPEEKAEGKFSPFSAVMQKIKNAITEPADMSLDELNVTPVSLGGEEDDLTSSFTKAYTGAPKSGTAAAPAAEEEKWEYVDENGNPVDPSEWEYVDEDGNPVDPSEWEYVDENGNPVA